MQKEVRGLPGSTPNSECSTCSDMQRNEEYGRELNYRRTALLLAMQRKVKRCSSLPLKCSADRCRFTHCSSLQPDVKEPCCFDRLTKLSICLH